MNNIHKILITCIIARVVGLIAVLAFVFGMVAITNNVKFIWLLLLILTIELIPSYDFRRREKSNEECGGN